jgi:hypothetical protein
MVSCKKKGCIYSRGVQLPDATATDPFLTPGMEACCCRRHMRSWRTKRRAGSAGPWRRLRIDGKHAPRKASLTQDCEKLRLRQRRAQGQEDGRDQGDADNRITGNEMCMLLVARSLILSVKFHIIDHRFSHGQRMPLPVGGYPQLCCIGSFGPDELAVQGN